ncbi:MAG: hypothetical protein CMO01_30435 [Thalassobius sp.]|nr:hypothetical protein [Thalassovita sp.]
MFFNETLKIHTKHFLYFLLFVIPGFATAQEKQMYCDVQVYNSGALQNVEVAFEVARLSEELQPTAIQANYQVLSNDKVVESKDISFTNTPVEKINSTFYFNFIIEQAANNARLKLTIKDLATGQSISKEVYLNKKEQVVTYSFRNISNPVYSGFVCLGEKFMLQDDVDKPIYLVRFKDNFLPAAPPMGNDMSGGSRELTVDSILTVRTNEPIILNQEALYFAQEDTSTVKGIGFRVVSPDFPKFKSVENLAHSMIYISTNKEINSFLNAEDKKAALDTYWINAGGSVDIAKRMIKEYYQRVTYANKSFTNYKAGWKTDRGMLYIVFGRPSEVISVENGEQWVYFVGKKRKRVTFEFVKKANIFSDFHYELYRSPAYKKFYFDAVELWRKGELFLP